MALTPLQFRDALMQNRIGLRRLSRGWVCLTESGTLLQRERDAKPTPEEAVEDALSRLQDRVANLRRVRALAALQAMTQSRIAIAPRIEGVGTPEEAVVWDAFSIDGTQLVTGAPSILAAVADATR